MRRQFGLSALKALDAYRVYVNQKSETNAKLKRMKRIMQACSSSGVPDWDEVYALSSHNTPMDILYMLGVMLLSILTLFGMAVVMLEYCNYFHPDSVAYTFLFQLMSPCSWAFRDR